MESLAQADELNEQLTDYVEALEELLDYTLRYPVTVAFPAMKVAIPQYQPGNLGHPIPEPRADDFKPKPPSGLATLVPGAEQRFHARCEQGRATFEQAHARWQHDEQQRQAQLARAEAEHKRATESAEEQHRRIDELEADFRLARDIIPEQASYGYVKTKGHIETKARTATDTQKLYKSVLAQLTLRTLYELFTADQSG
jgi:restriction system protein